MSMHSKPLTPLEREGLEAHGLDIGTPSQLSDVFRQGLAFALSVPRLPTDEMRDLHRLYHLAPKGAPVDFNEDVELPGHKISENRSSAPVRVSFDAAEGDGRVWLMDPDDNWIAVEGESNARELARLLLAWADTYETAEGAQ